MAGKCLLRIGPMNPAEIARDLSTETISQAPLQTPCRELHSGKVDSRCGTNHSPNAPLLSKATLAFFSPSPLVSIGQRGSGLPLAPWALLLCWWSTELEIHSKRVPLRGQAGVGWKMPSGRRPQLSPQSQLGTSAPRPHLTHGPNEVLRAAFWKHRLSSGNKPQCKCTFAQQSNAGLFQPLAIGSP